MEIHPWICATCGVEYAASAEPPAHCPVCEDERQYLGPKGQIWTTPAELAANHAVELRELEPGLHGVGVKPSFCIGQRAIFIEHPQGGVLFDCVSMVDDAAVAEIERRGGLRAIAPSHPHFYGAMVSWSERFGGIPIWVHEGDREWVVRPSPNVRFWSGTTQEIGPGFTLVHLDGHFAGAQALHWSGGPDGAGVVACGDTINVAQDTRWMSFMRSNPNYIPMSPRAVRRIVDVLAPFSFERLYGSQWPKIVKRDAKGVLARSAERYLTAIDAPVHV
jgi:glyoxylase-like metal-dependent hydrolase (beta-lactamase superfamily II)